MSVLALALAGHAAGQKKLAALELDVAQRPGEPKVEPKSGLRFLPVPGGAFPFQGARSVTVKPFLLGETATTVDGYARCVRAGACTEAKEGERCNWKTDRTNHPINCVDWSQAVAFCKWIGGRLPTEEEREYAAAGGAESREYPWGDGEPGAKACWNGQGNDLGKGNRKGTCPVGGSPASRAKWGHLDLAGNVHEWLARDRESSTRVLSGGSWSNDTPDRLRARSRLWFFPTSVSFNVGFRCGL